MNPASDPDVRFITHYSCGAAPDFHGIPYSFQLIGTPLHGYDKEQRFNISKEMRICKPILTTSQKIQKKNLYPF
jgi:hypothetical protein